MATFTFQIGRSFAVPLDGPKYLESPGDGP